ncbi:hypothetical protein [Streptomyces sp. NPDC005780]|uniref:hypothetical protein n=1 Tax=Streptomyces sp. NPDC005780 TaxID=3364730 RepID=UPI0036BEE247
MISRRGSLATAVAAVLTGASATTARAAGPHEGAGSHARLQHDTDAVLATGATGVLAEVQTAGGRTTARAGRADRSDPSRPVPWDAYYRLGSDTKTFTAVLIL